MSDGVANTWYVLTLYGACASLVDARKCAQLDGYCFFGYPTKKKKNLTESSSSTNSPANSPEESLNGMDITNDVLADHATEGNTDTGSNIASDDDTNHHVDSELSDNERHNNTTNLQNILTATQQTNNGNKRKRQQPEWYQQMISQENETASSSKSTSDEEYNICTKKKSRSKPKVGRR